MEKSSSRQKLISIVTPCFNEEGNVRECHDTVRRLFESELSSYDFEHLFCDNASTDGTVTLLREMAAVDSRVKVILNARNFGPFCSMFNGIMAARGDAVVCFLPADLQDPPELIPEFVRRWEEGHEVVYGIRANREESKILAALRKAYYRLVTRAANIVIPENAGEFQLADRAVIEALRRFDDYYPYVRGMIASCGFRTCGVEYLWKARRRGVSKNNFFNLVDQGLNGAISFSKVPLRLCLTVGFGISFLSLLYAVASFVANLISYRKLATPGIATLIVSVFFFAGVQLFFLGVLGEYIGAIHFQVRKRPLVIERERINLDVGAD